MSVALYLSGKDEMVAAVSALDAEQLARVCPACPAWSVQDVVAHHVHVCCETVSGARPGAVSAALSAEDPETRVAAGAERDRWTQAGVEERRGRAVPELIAEWDACASVMDESASFITLDLAMHLFDIREALGDEAGRSSPLVVDALEGYYWFSLAPRLAHAGLSVTVDCDEPRLRLETEGAPVVRGRAYDVLRSIGGRRSRDEADRLLDWGSAPEPVREMFSLYGWPHGVDAG